MYDGVGAVPPMLPLENFDDGLPLPSLEQLSMPNITSEVDEYARSIFGTIEPPCVSPQISKTSLVQKDQNDTVEYDAHFYEFVNPLLWPVESQVPLKLSQ